MWGSIIGGAIGGIGSLLGGKKKAKQAKQATQAGLNQVNMGRDAIANSPLQGVAAGGGRAYDAQLDALGVNGADGNSRAGTAFQTFADSAGYGSALKGGNEALTASMSAAGMRNSGAALKGAVRFGQGLGAQYFNNYIQNLMGTSQQGISAGSSLNANTTSLAGTGANVALGGGLERANASGNAISDFGGIIGGTVADIWGGPKE
jgi:hypothetical protein